jgi:Dissimilatory sulfite reductase (desulfoviridin), alpha and beta subunits
MIFYFSGTGNSLHAAKMTAEATNEKLLYIPEELHKGELTYEIREGELLGFVFPIYAWGPPFLVLDLIKQMKISGKISYIFSIATCGDEEGNTTDRIRKELAVKGLSLDSALTLSMPNNYIVGFDVDTKELQKEKLEKADQKLKHFHEILREKKKGEFLIHPGSLPKMKSNLINPLFNHFALNTKRFYATDLCISCGLCEKCCPVHTIKVEGKPIWGRKCTQCLACINRCPVHAIQYGKGTLSKGRYVHPDLKA